MITIIAIYCDCLYHVYHDYTCYYNDYMYHDYRWFIVIVHVYDNMCFIMTVCTMIRVAWFWLCTVMTDDILWLYKMYVTLYRSACISVTVYYYIPWIKARYCDCIYHDYCCVIDCIYHNYSCVIMTVYIPWLLLLLWLYIYHVYCDHSFDLTSSGMNPGNLQDKNTNNK